MITILFSQNVEIKSWSTGFEETKCAWKEHSPCMMSGSTSCYQRPRIHKSRSYLFGSLSFIFYKRRMRTADMERILARMAEWTPLEEGEKRYFCCNTLVINWGHLPSVGSHMAGLCMYALNQNLQGYVNRRFHAITQATYSAEQIHDTLCGAAKAPWTFFLELCHNICSMLLAYISLLICKVSTFISILDGIS